MTSLSILVQIQAIPTRCKAPCFVSEYSVLAHKIEVLLENFGVRAYLKRATCLEPCRGNFNSALRRRGF